MAFDDAQMDLWLADARILASGDALNRLEAAERLAALPAGQLLPVLERLAQESAPAALETALEAWLELEGGLGFTVRLREAALKDRTYKPIAQGLFRLLQIAYAGAFLAVRPLNWESPALLLEKVMEQEQVHRFAGWEDMKNRLDLDRRLFVLTHLAEPLAPVAFLEVALVEELAESVQALLDVGSAVLAPDDARVAVFYSINSVQPGLRGISFGERLIHEAVRQLKRDFPRLHTFSTLSPVPTLRSWLLGLDGEALGRYAARELRRAGLNAAAARDKLAAGNYAAGAETRAVRALVEQAAADYLSGSGNAALVRDPVARFHLGNGARLERINWQGDTSENGQRQSFGVMVNYLYDLESLARNKAAFRQQAVPVVSRRLGRLVRGARRQLEPESQASAGPSGPA